MSIDFADWIQDGTVLSQVMTTLCFNSVERDKYGAAGCSPEEERIKSLQAQILDYGVDSKFMFKIDDILLKRNTPKVIRCLEEVAKLVSIFEAFKRTNDLEGNFQSLKLKPGYSLEVLVLSDERFFDNELQIIVNS